MLKRLLALAVCLAAPAMGQEKAFTLQSPAELTETGFLRHLLPRFSLKTGIRITVTEEASDIGFGADGDPVFRQSEVIWYFRDAGAPPSRAFYDWLTSDVGKRTIEGFAPGGEALFSADVSQQTAAVVVERTGDAALGEDVSMAQCGRCHVVNASNKMNAIGSTPSFALMRNFDDWEGRFQSFFVLKPHAAFTQVADVTPPFPDNLPSPIAPVEVTVEEIDAIVAFVATIPPADLGAPVQSQ